jgi:hypothetical protein
MNAKLSSELEKRKKLKHSELFVLDNSLRESTVGQLRGHTLENKWKIYDEVSKCHIMQNTKTVDQWRPFRWAGGNCKFVVNFEGMSRQMLVAS